MTDKHMMLEDYVIDVESVEDMLSALRRGYEKVDIYLRLKEYSKTKKELVELGGTILLFDKEVRKLSLPHHILNLPGGTQ